MITTNNYSKEIKKIDFSSLPEALRKGHEFLEKATSSGDNWSLYHSSISIKKTIDTYLEKLNEFIDNNKKVRHSSTNKNLPEKKAQPFIRETDILNPDINQHNNPKENKKRTSRKINDHDQAVMVERIPDELRFIRRFVNLNGKTKTKDELLRFINSLQKAIVEKRIRKTSSYAEQISFIQNKLIDIYNSMKTKIAIELKPDTYEALKKLTGSEKVLASIGFIKRYIGLNGKLGVKEKAKQLLGQINRAIERGQIPDNDPYSVEMYEIKKNLKAFVTGKQMKSLEIETAALNGLEGILGCACQPKMQKPKPTIMSSMDFADLEFDTIGLRGKWYHLIGDPSPNFKGMVSGKPKLGKSTLCIEFAGYLARNHGKVLYVAKEEGLDYTLQQKLNSKDVAHPNLDVASVLPDNLTPYSFIFLDSVTRMGLKPEDLTRLEQTYPDKAFVYIHQTTKDGRFRGANAFQHNVDVVIDVPEKGKAVQMGRFNQGGEVNIFEDDMPVAA
ncbi:MAG: hypothetical protein ACK4E0_03365 [Chitinophagaceae bacterium]